MPYPEVFRNLALELHVWHRNALRSKSGQDVGQDVLIGIAQVDLWALAPPRAAVRANEALHSGFAQVDGYFHIMASQTESMLAEDTEPTMRGQIRASVSPHWMPIPQSGQHASGRSTAYGSGTLEHERSYPLVNNATFPGAGEGIFTGSPAIPRMRPMSSEPLEALWADVPDPGLPERLPSAFTTCSAFGSRLRDSLYRPGLLGPAGRCAGVEDDVSEMTLRVASRLSETELRLRSLKEDQLLACHNENLASLERLQLGMLPQLGLPAGRPRQTETAAGAGGPLPVGRKTSSDAMCSAGAKPPIAASVLGPTPFKMEAAGPLPSWGNARPSPPGPLMSSSQVLGGHAAVGSAFPKLSEDKRLWSASGPSDGHLQAASGSLHGLLAGEDSRAEELLAVGRAMAVGGASSAPAFGLGAGSAAEPVTSPRQQLLAEVGRAAMAGWGEDSTATAGALTQP